MTETSILSYKKPTSNKNSSSVPGSAPSTPILSHSGSPAPPTIQSPVSIDSPRSSSSTTTNVGASTRKVSARRKALQDFYHLNSNSDNATTDGNDTTNEGISKISNLNDIDNLIKTAPIEEILKIRNDLSAKLNSSNQTKKSIIYDNYYELIKLSNTLSDLSTSKPRKKSVSTGLKIFADDEDNGEDSGDKNSTELTKEGYVDQVLKELSEFASKEAPVFNGTFNDVLGKLKEQDESDNSSMIVLNDDKPTEKEESSEDIEKQISHINYILNLPLKTNINDTEREQAIEYIDKVILDNPDNEILSLQLGKIKHDITT
ncbi:VPS51 [Candida albicans]